MASILMAGIAASVAVSTGETRSYTLLKTLANPRADGEARVCWPRWRLMWTTAGRYKRRKESRCILCYMQQQLVARGGSNGAWALFADAFSAMEDNERSLNPLIDNVLEGNQHCSRSLRCSPKRKNDIGATSSADAFPQSLFRPPPRRLPNGSKNSKTRPCLPQW